MGRKYETKLGEEYVITCLYVHIYMCVCISVMCICSLKSQPKNSYGGVSVPAQTILKCKQQNSAAKRNLKISSS